MKNNIRFFIIALITLFPLSTAYALEGDCEAGGIATSFLSPDAKVYGGGAEFYFRYSVLDGLSFSAHLGLVGARDRVRQQDLGLYYTRVGFVYALDILEWVPALGIHVCEVISEAKEHPWKGGANGLSLDFDFQLAYRGIRQVGLGLNFTYHSVFKTSDYMSVGFSVSWHSDSF